MLTLRIEPLGIALSIVLALTSAVSAAEWGSIEGQVILDGEAPKLPLIINKGDAAVKDAAVCAAADHASEAAVINSENKGIANVCVYLKTKPKMIHPDLESLKDMEVIIDQKGCTFLPHVSIVQVGQTAKCINGDAVSHNLHTNPFVNSADNFILKPSDTVGSNVIPKSAEKTPVKVICDIHPHMVSYWIVVDHPYTAITDTDGKFKIENLPVGKHTFVVWQESAGYVVRALDVEVKAGATTTVPVQKLPVAKLKLK